MRAKKKPPNAKHPTTYSSAGGDDVSLASPSDEQLVATIRNLTVILACRRNASRDLSPHDDKQNERLAKIVKTTETLLRQQRKEEQKRLVRNHLLPGLHEAYDIYHGKAIGADAPNKNHREGVSLDYLTEHSLAAAEVAARRICQAWAEFCLAARRNDGPLPLKRARQLLPDAHANAVDAKGPREWARDRATVLLKGGAPGAGKGRALGDKWLPARHVNGYFFRAFDPPLDQGAASSSEPTPDLRSGAPTGLSAAVEQVVQDSVGDLLLQARQLLSDDVSSLVGERAAELLTQRDEMMRQGASLNEAKERLGSGRASAGSLAAGEDGGS